ncbi:MAG: RNA 2',3'-cyclic phosphodiesterase [bacterium]
MRHRIFIAINLPEKIKKELAGYENKWLELPCRWTKTENLHITLAFLGYLTDEEMLEVLKITRNALKEREPFSISLNKICYGPAEEKSGRPRMVWAKGEKTEALADLQDNLVKALESEENRGFSFHLTLGRLKQWEFQKMELEERPEINEDINLNFEVNSVEVMESELKRGGPTYTILESCPLKT